MDFIEFDEPEFSEAGNLQENYQAKQKENYRKPDEEADARVPTPFDRDGDPDEKTSFDFIELDQTSRARVKPRSEIIICPSCGASNPANSDFCYDCQGELVTFRQVELDVKPVKVVLKFSKTRNYKICDICGAHNEAGSNFCRDCASTLQS
jgi:ribosomal protein L40E